MLYIGLGVSSGAGRRPQPGVMPSWTASALSSQDLLACRCRRGLGTFLGRLWIVDRSYRIATENGLTDYSRLSMKHMPNFDELLEAFLRV